MMNDNSESADAPSDSLRSLEKRLMSLSPSPLGLTWSEVERRAQGSEDELVRLAAGTQRDSTARSHLSVSMAWMGGMLAGAALVLVWQQSSLVDKSDPHLAATPASSSEIAESLNHSTVAGGGEESVAELRPTFAVAPEPSDRQSPLMYVASGLGGGADNLSDLSVGSGLFGKQQLALRDPLSEKYSLEPRSAPRDGAHAPAVTRPAVQQPATAAHLRRTLLESHELDL
jgi:hypothetical protein